MCIVMRKRGGVYIAALHIIGTIYYYNAVIREHDFEIQ